LFRTDRNFRKCQEGWRRSIARRPPPPLPPWQEKIEIAHLEKKHSQTFFRSAKRLAAGKAPLPRAKHQDRPFQRTRQTGFFRWKSQKRIVFFPLGSFFLGKSPSKRGKTHPAGFRLLGRNLWIRAFWPRPGLGLFPRQKMHPVVVCRNFSALLRRKELRAETGPEIRKPLAVLRKPLSSNPTIWGLCPSQAPARKDGKWPFHQIPWRERLIAAAVGFLKSLSRPRPFFPLPNWDAIFSRDPKKIGQTGRGPRIEPAPFVPPSQPSPNPGKLNISSYPRNWSRAEKEKGRKKNEGRSGQQGTRHSPPLQKLGLLPPSPPREFLPANNAIPQRLVKSKFKTQAGTGANPAAPSPPLGGFLGPPRRCRRSRLCIPCKRGPLPPSAPPRGSGNRVG